MRKFIIKVLLFSLTPLLWLMPLVIYNIWLDPFGVIKSNMKIQKTEPNQHYLKVKYCLNNPKKHNAFLFGSSRVGKIDVSKIHDENNWYNFTYSEAVPFETLQNIKLLIKYNIEIKKILVGLDEISYLVSPELHKHQSLRKPYVNQLDPYLNYLFLRPSISMYNSIMNADTSEFYSKGAYEVIYTNGSFPPNKKDVFIERNPILHEKDSAFNKPYWPSYNKERIDKTIFEISEIKKICGEHNIEVIFFINPIYQRTYIKAINNKFLVFLEKLTTITEYYDFSGLNGITSNKLNYYENSHYRPIIGDWIVKEITHSDKKYLITRSNISSIIQKKKMEADK